MIARRRTLAAVLALLSVGLPSCAGTAPPAAAPPARPQAGVSFAQPVAAMEPTVRRGQQVDAPAVAPGYAGAVGDVVAIRPADSWVDVATGPVALRVVATAGATVACCDPRNRVLVDGLPVDESYLYYDPAAGAARQAPFGPVTVPAGTVWLMGDNRNDSADSRVPGQGPVPVEWVVAVVPSAGLR